MGIKILKVQYLTALKCTQAWLSVLYACLALQPTIKEERAGLPPASQHTVHTSEAAQQRQWMFMGSSLHDAALVAQL